MIMFFYIMKLRKVMGCDVLYGAVIGDIVDSRQLEDRYLVQEQLKQVIEDINTKYREDLAAGFVLTLGDEFQGLFNQGEHLLEVLDYIRLKMYPVKVRFGVGFGDMTTAIDPARAIGADGPAFYAARAAINAIKDLGGRYESPISDVVIRTYNRQIKESQPLALVDELLSAASLIEHKWTSKQREIIELLSLQALSQREIGQVLEVSQANVHGRIASSGYYTYRHCMEGLKAYIKAYWEVEDGQ